MKVYDPFLAGIGDVYAKYKTDAEKSVKRQKLTSQGILFLSLISVIILGVLLTRDIVTPLKRVTRTANKIAEGDIPEVSYRATKEKSRNEITQMEDAFAEDGCLVKRVVENSGQDRLGRSGDVCEDPLGKRCPRKCDRKDGGEPQA